MSNELQALQKRVNELQAENEKLKYQVEAKLEPLCEHETHEILHETEVCKEEMDELRAENLVMREALEEVSLKPWPDSSAESLLRTLSARAQTVLSCTPKTESFAKYVEALEEVAEAVIDGSQAMTNSMIDAANRRLAGAVSKLEQAKQEMK